MPRVLRSLLSAGRRDGTPAAVASVAAIDAVARVGRPGRTGRPRRSGKRRPRRSARGAGRCDGGGGTVRPAASGRRRWRARFRRHLDARLGAVAQRGSYSHQAAAPRFVGRHRCSAVERAQLRPAHWIDVRVPIDGLEAQLLLFPRLLTVSVAASIDLSGPSRISRGGLAQATVHDAEPIDRRTEETVVLATRLGGSGCQPSIESSLTSTRLLARVRWHHRPCSVSTLRPPGGCDGRRSCSSSRSCDGR